MNPELKLIYRFGENEKVVGITYFQDRLIVATEDSIYEMTYDGQDYHINKVGDKTIP